MTVNTGSFRASDNSIVKFECYDRLESTVELARKYARAGYPDRYAVISEYDESKGGERGVYLSCILRPSIFPSQAGLLSSLAATAFATALEEHTDKRIGIGWVSNIYCEGKQIGYAKIEGKLDNFSSYEYIIVCFYAVLSDEDFPPRLTDLMRKVFESGNSSIATLIAKNILNKLLPFYVTIKNNTKFMNTYKQKFILGGAKIKRLVDGRKETCKVVSIDPEDCSLIVLCKKGEEIRITNPKSIILPKSVKLIKRKQSEEK